MIHLLEELLYFNIPIFKAYIKSLMNKMKNIQIAIAEDHDLVREGIVSLLKGETNLKVIGDFSNGRDLITFLHQKKVDVVILDIEMPEMNGVEVLQIISEDFKQVKAIMLSMYVSPEFISECMSLGAKAFLPKNCDIEELVLAINSVHEKGFYFNDLVSEVLLNQISKSTTKDNSKFKNALSEREVDIIVFICEGLQNKEMADKLSVSIRTIEGHRKNISKKTKANHVADIIRYAVNNGIYNFKQIKE